MKIKTLLRVRENWIQGTDARTKAGIWCSAANPHAACWCLLGAARKCYPDKEERDEAIHKLYRAVRELFGRRVSGYSISVFNDSLHTTFADIKKVLAKADV